MVCATAGSPACSAVTQVANSWRVPSVSVTAAVPPNGLQIASPTSVTKARAVWGSLVTRVRGTCNGGDRGLELDRLVLGVADAVWVV